MAKPMVTNFALHSDGGTRFHSRKHARALVLEIEDNAGCEALLTDYLTELGTEIEVPMEPVSSACAAAGGGSAAILF